MDELKRGRKANAPGNAIDDRNTNNRRGIKNDIEPDQFVDIQFDLFGTIIAGIIRIFFLTKWTLALHCFDTPTIRDKKLVGVDTVREGRLL
ncbi:hypothetical protein V2O64_01010 [Verrucomicrobiaceae bacterium 227]